MSIRLPHGRTHQRATTLTSTLILLSMLIAMVSMVIGISVALAFSLVGALSIVRFRTVVEVTLRSLEMLNIAVMELNHIEGIQSVELRTE